MHCRRVIEAPNDRRQRAEQVLHVSKGIRLAGMGCGTSKLARVSDSQGGARLNSVDAANNNDAMQDGERENVPRSVSHSSTTSTNTARAPVVTSTNVAMFSGEVDQADRWTFKKDLAQRRRRTSRKSTSVTSFPPEMRVVAFTETNWVALPLGDAVWPDDLPPGTSDLNRYRNVLPNPSTRVQLAAADASDGTDVRAGYINANYVRGARLAPNEPSRPRCYIATMGPLQHTVGHFWRMVWQENTTVIIMVTGLIEGGKSKCERYWPEEGGTLDVCGFRVSSVETAKHAGVTLTKLELFHGGQSRIVHHFWHEHWPDHTQPKNPRSSAGVVLQMLACARRLGPTSSAPWVVHCSAGVGRSGTVIAIDYGIDLLTSAASCDVAKIIGEIRRDRAHMVASLDQAMFVYEALSLYADVYNKALASRERHRSTSSS